MAFDERVSRRSHLGFYHILLQLVGRPAVRRGAEVYDGHAAVRVQLILEAGEVVDPVVYVVIRVAQKDEIHPHRQVRIVGRRENTEEVRQLFTPRTLVEVPGQARAKRTGK